MAFLTRGSIIAVVAVQCASGLVLSSSYVQGDEYSGPHPSPISFRAGQGAEPMLTKSGSYVGRVPPPPSKRNSFEELVDPNLDQIAQTYNKHTINDGSRPLGFDAARVVPTFDPLGRTLAQGQALPTDCVIESVAEKRILSNQEELPVAVHR